MTKFEPAFEVTHVESMQWNRTTIPFHPGVEEAASAAVYPLPADLLDRVRLAVKQEAAYVSVQPALGVSAI